MRVSRPMSHPSPERRVLVVEDDEAERMALARLMRDEGFDVILAEDGEQALLVLEHQATPDLILLDLMMPRVTGWQVLQALERTPRLADIPVIVLTAFAARGGLPAGCRVLHKPLDREVLLAEAHALTRVPADAVAGGEGSEGQPSARWPTGSPISPSGFRRRLGRVLVIDDEHLIGQSLRRVLSTENEVVTVTDAIEALARLHAAERYDVVLCDLMMPIMDGIELHRRLSITYPEEAERMVFMTGGAMTARVDAFFRRVPNLLLDKPIDLDGLRALIERRVGSPLAAASGRGWI
jgi:CheY-like chemotaxis protein